MKLNLTLDVNNVLSDHVNINPLASPESSTQIQGDVATLETWVDESECEQIIALDLLDFIDMNNKPKVLDHWISRLKHGGALIVSGIEIYECTKMIFNRSLDLPTANALLYGNNLLKKGLYSVEHMKSILVERGMVIESVKMESVNYCIKAVRP